MFLFLLSLEEMTMYGQCACLIYPAGVSTSHSFEDTKSFLFQNVHVVA